MKDGFSPILVVAPVVSLDDNVVIYNQILPTADSVNCPHGVCYVNGTPNPVQPVVDWVYILPETTIYTVELSGINFDFGYGPNSYEPGYPDITRNFAYHIAFAPEPATLATMAFGLAGAGLMAARRRARRG